MVLESTNQTSRHHSANKKILHPQLEVDAITEFHAITTSVCSRTQARKSISRKPICLTDDYYDHILEEFGRREKN